MRLRRGAAAPVGSAELRRSEAPSSIEESGLVGDTIPTPASKSTCELEFYFGRFSVRHPE